MSVLVVYHRTNKHLPPIVHDDSCPHGRRSKHGIALLFAPTDGVLCSYCHGRPFVPIGQNGVVGIKHTQTPVKLMPVGRYTQRNRHEARIPCECPACGSGYVERSPNRSRSWYCRSCTWEGAVTAKWERVALPPERPRVDWESFKKMKYESNGGFLAVNDAHWRLRHAEKAAQERKR